MLLTQMLSHSSRSWSRSQQKQTPTTLTFLLAIVPFTSRQFTLPHLSILMSSTFHRQRRRRRGCRRQFSSSLSSPSTLYPLHPPDSRWLARVVSDADLTWWDYSLVAASSCIIVGAVVWVPCCLAWAFQKWRKQLGDRNDASTRRRRALYAALAVAAVGVYAGWAPQRNHRLGDWLQIRTWKLWKAWIKFLAVEILLDQPKTQSVVTGGNNNNNPPQSLSEMDAILAFVPHGIFPFAFGVGVLTDFARQVFGTFRPIVASAVLHVPILGDLVGWLHGLDANKASVQAALQQGHRVGVIPGGISEMFTGYPRPGCHPDEEYVIVRKGFLRMAVRYNKPVVPIYCFGSTKLFRRWHLPALETLSNLLRVSVIVFYGVWGLPIPFRQRLTYVVGDPIPPPSPPTTISTGVGADGTTTVVDEAQVDAMYEQFCQELHRLFERHKEAYGWGHKTLRLLSK